MMRQLFSSFAGNWTKSLRKAPRRRRSGRALGSFHGSSERIMSLEHLESRVVLNGDPVITPMQNLFMVEDQVQTVQYLATFTQFVDTDFPNYTATINWGDGTGLDNSALEIYEQEPVPGGIIIHGRIQAAHQYANGIHHTISITLDDGAGNSDSASFGVDVYPFGGPGITSSGASSVNEGDSYDLTITSNFFAADSKIFWGDSVQNGGIGGPVSEVSHTYADNTLADFPFQILVAATQDGTNWFVDGGLLVNVVDVAPILTIGGAGSVAAGDVYTLNLSSFDPGPDRIALWAIDWDYDGIEFDPAAEIFVGNPSSVTHIYADNGPRQIRALAVDDDSNLVESNVIDVTVGASLPTANAGGPYTTLADLPITLTGVGVGGAGNYTYAWDLDGDTVFGEAGEVGESVTFDPAGVPGTRTVSLKVTDEDGGESEVAETTIEVLATGALVVDDTLHVVGSSTGGDNVSITVSGTDLIVNTGSGLQTFGQSSVSELNIRTGGGNDVINIAAGVTVPTTVDAGDGNDLIIGGNGRSVLMGGAGADIIYGGAGDDVLLGGTGNDLVLGGGGNDSLTGGGGVDILEGGAGNDLVVGGVGNDALLGGAGEDILIGGFTVHDNNVVALDEIMAIWTGGGTLNARVALLTAVNGLLETNVAVLDDNAIDLITGGAGADFIIADRSLLGDGAIDLIALQSAQDRLIALN